MTAIEIRKELAQVEARKLQLTEMLVEESQGKLNSCGYPWRPVGSCGYCGSMSVAEAIKRLETPGTAYSGSDWKYSWPHKFYIGNGYPHKFYNSHLQDATSEEFRAFNALSERYFDVSWFHDGPKIRSRCVPGTQRCGTVAWPESVTE